MKREDIDKRIGMPDVDAEWAKFEREVIDTSAKPRFQHVATWAVGIGIAAAILLLFVLNTDMEKATEMPLKAEQVALNSHQNDTPTSHQDDNVMRLGSTETDTLPISHSKSIFDLDNEQLQKRIAQLTIVPSSADLGSGNIIRLGGDCPKGSNESVLVVIDGKPVPMPVDLLSTATTEDFERFFETDIESIIVYKDENNKLPYIQKYGELGKRGVIDIKTKLDTQVTVDMHGHIAGLDISQRSNDVVHKDSLLVESTLRKSLANKKEAVQPVQFDLNTLVIVVNKQQLPDSLSKLIRYKVRQYYHQQGMMVATQKDWSAYGAKYDSGYDKNCPLMELTVVPDTLSDAYVSQHPEMQQVLRHVSGVVMDENNRPLADVWIGIRGAGAGAPTDSTGHFSFWMPREEQRLYAECLGYVSKRNIPADSSLTIRLRSATVIREVKVIPKSDSLKHYHFLKQ